MLAPLCHAQTSGIVPSKLQLVGVTAMYIAAKMEVCCHFAALVLLQALRHRALARRPFLRVSHCQLHTISFFLFFQEVCAVSAADFALATAGATTAQEVKDLEAFMVSVRVYRGVPKFWTHQTIFYVFVTSACARRTGAAARVERRRRER